MIRKFVKIIFTYIFCITACFMMFNNNLIASDSNQEVRIDLNFSTNECYLGEAVSVTLEWLSSDPIGCFKAVDVRFPAMRDPLFSFYDSAKDVDQPNKKSLGLPLEDTRSYANKGNKLIDGVDYNVLSVKKILVPKQVGSLIIKPASVSCARNKNISFDRNSKHKNVASGSLYQYPLYFNNSFFDNEISSDDKVYHAVSQTYRLKVLPLPSNAPAFFDGLVGEYSISVDAATVDLRKGDPLVLTINVKSAGYLANVQPLDLGQRASLTNLFRVASDMTFKGLNNDSIIFTQTIYPLTTDVKAVPPIELVYFNPQKGVYEVAKSLPIPVHVRDSKIVDGSSLGSDVSIPKNEFTWNQLLYMPILILLATLFFIERSHVVPVQNVIQRNPALLYEDFCNTLDGIKKDDGTNEKVKGEILYISLRKYMSGFMSDYQPGAVTFDDVCCALPDMDLKDLKVLFETCEFFLFSGVTMPSLSIEALISSAEREISNLNKVLT